MNSQTAPNNSSNAQAMKHSLSLSEIEASPAMTEQSLRMSLARDGSKVPHYPGTNIGMQSVFEHQQEQQRVVSIGSMNKAAVFWDFENCPPPSGMPGYVVVDNIRKVIHHFGHITLFKAYLEINENSATQRGLRSELQSSGVSLTDVPHNGRKDATDKMILVDMLAFAIDHPPPATIVLISGDKDFVYALSTLRNRRYSVVLIVPNRGAPIILKSQANAILEWRYDVLNQDVWSLQQQQLLGHQTGSTSSNIEHRSPGSEGSAAPLLTSTITVTSASSSSTNTSSVRSVKRDSSPERESPLRVQTLPATQAVAAEVDYIGYCFSPKAPGFFDLLVEVLEKFRMGGEPKPRRSKVGNELSSRNPLLYHRAGCSSFREYVDLAVKEGIVEIGGEKGLAWISLHEDYRDKLFK